MSHRIVGIDIGGANLKYASVDGVALSRRFPMWRQSDELAACLSQDLESLGQVDAIAVTMTGELADCFVDRSEGVAHIAKHALQAAEQRNITATLFYGVDGRFLPHSSVYERADVIAAANWHALAQFVGLEIAGNAVLIDIGTTTTDIIPIRDGAVATSAQTDFDRLQQRSLVYVGCRRTPICSLVDELTIGGRPTPVMNEYFATIDDARLLIGFVTEQSTDFDSADGKPRMREFAANRLARMIGLDRRNLTVADTAEIADQVHAAAKRRINLGVQQVIGDTKIDDTKTIVLSGHGSDLIDIPSRYNCILLEQELGHDVSRCAPAYAVARLLQRQRS